MKPETRSGCRTDRRRYAGAIAVLMSLLFVGCSHETKEGLTPLTLNEVAHSIFYAPQYVACEEGYFEDEGIDLKLETGFGADKTMTALISGNADIGFMGSEATIYAYINGEDDYAVNFAQLTQRAGNFLVGKEEEEEFCWRDLRGKTVLGGRAGGMPEMVFEYILKQNGLDPKLDLTIDQSVDFGLTAAAFCGNPEQFDYTVEFEPHATNLEQEGNGYVIASLGVDSGYVPYTSYCAKKSFLQKNEKLIDAFVRAIQRGLDYVNSHTAAETARVILPQFPETDEVTLTRIVDRYLQQDTWKANTIMSKDSFLLLENILIEAEQMQETVPYEELVNCSSARKAVSEEK